jgi:hypothetical protein
MKIYRDPFLPKYNIKYDFMHLSHTLEDAIEFVKRKKLECEHLKEDEELKIVYEGEIDENEGWFNSIEYLFIGTRKKFPCYCGWIIEDVEPLNSLPQMK